MNNDMSPKVPESRLGMQEALKNIGIDREWFADLIGKLGDTPKQTQFQGQFITSKHPDPHAARIALDNVGRILKLFAPEEHNVNIYDNHNDTELDDAIDKEFERSLEIRRIKRQRARRGGSKNGGKNKGSGSDKGTKEKG